MYNAGGLHDSYVPTGGSIGFAALFLLLVFPFARAVADDPKPVGRGDAVVTVSVAAEKRIVVFGRDCQPGRLAHLGDVQLEGEPAALVVDPGRRFLFSALRAEGKVPLLRIEVCLDDAEAQRGGCWDPGKQNSANKLRVRQVGNHPDFSIDQQGYQCLVTPSSWWIFSFNGSLRYYRSRILFVATQLPLFGLMDFMKNGAVSGFLLSILVPFSTRTLRRIFLIAKKKYWSSFIVLWAQQEALMIEAWPKG